MIERDGIDAVANRYSDAATASGRRATVNRWLRGGTPRGRTARSIAVRGRAVTGAAVQTQDERGRLVYLTDPRAIAASESIIQQRRLALARMRDEARTPADYELVEMMEQTDIEGDAQQFAFNWQERLDELRIRSAEGEEYYEDSELFLDWAEWRSAYSEM